MINRIKLILTFLSALVFQMTEASTLNLIHLISDGVDVKEKIK